MRSRSRYTIKPTLADFKCDFSLEKEEEIKCSDCGCKLQRGLAMEIVNGMNFCEECSPWYQQQQREDELLLAEDLKRHEKYLKHLISERDFWD